MHGDDQAVGLERALVPETERCLPYVQETSVAVGFVGFVVVLDARSREHVGDGDVLGQASRREVQAAYVLLLPSSREDVERVPVAFLGRFGHAERTVVVLEGLAPGRIVHPIGARDAFVGSVEIVVVFVVCDRTFLDGLELGATWQLRPVEVRVERVAL